MLVLLLFLIDALSGGVLRSNMRLTAATISRWTDKTSAVVSVRTFFSSRAALEAQNRTLTEEVADLSERAGRANLLQRENDDLRALAHLAQNSPGVTAPVLSSLSASPYGTFLIGAGASGSVARGGLVLTKSGFVVGRINEVTGSTALVSEIFAPNASIEALLNGALVQVKGQGGGNGRTEVSRDLRVAVGDVVVVPQFGQRGIGVVGAVASSSASASQQVYIRLPNTFSELQFVYVTPANQ